MQTELFTLGALVTESRGGTSIKTTEYTTTGTPVLTKGDIKPFGRVEHGGKYVNPQYAKEKKWRHTETGDLIVTTRDLTLAADFLGLISPAPIDNNYVVNQGATIFKIDEKLINPRYLVYWSAGKEYRNYIKGNHTGSTQIHIRQAELFNAPVRLPTLAVQQKIVSILGCLDDKIELNRQINTTLESIAQALFKSWFVDFDPIIDNALASGNEIPEPLLAKAEKRKALGDQRKPLPDGLQQQFPDRFVFTEEMGWVPEGWVVGSFGDVASHIRENVKADNVADFQCYVGLEHIGRKQLFLTHHGTGETIESNKSKFLANDLLFGKLRAYFHKVCLAPKDGICSTDILVFRAKRAHLHAFMAMTAYSSSFVEYADLRSTGTRMPRANAKDLLSYPIIVPPAVIGEAFEVQTAPLWARGKTAVSESDALVSLRDTVLPKLLSGELRIPAAEKKIARVV